MNQPPKIEGNPAGLHTCEDCRKEAARRYEVYCPKCQKKIVNEQWAKKINS
jgi:ribosomal protein L37AE/L43A